MAKGPVREMGVARRKSRSPQTRSQNHGMSKALLQTPTRRESSKTKGVHARPPRGSKKTSVGKRKRTYTNRGSYSTHGKR